MDRLRSQGIAIVYISHRMDEVYRIADRITILRNGRNLHRRPGRDHPQEIVAGIVGKDVAATAGPRRELPSRDPLLLDVQDLHAAGVAGATFQVHAGEVVGIAGLMGAGRTDSRGRSSASVASREA